ncbi:hypothetical protein AA103196_2371 [Ameyamaea chiangmaiensis NBRC 103196]|uniref:DUF1330 domain-containing protein n=1 Tax=Ameyamaea chiangmaiensis TaxID=442969 RepID=A0A850PFG5_9PROT|nr:DUF1330 domain-containing protein [Ameyamaea chiangmaiensis]MBS4075372.1 DUF1330 domain-containing protein [Ameyamaea chiangmaiensis]NVN39861.1 DUF1330 domain-containing protein [Ameyamaea chiangmaiensis]GBQ69997.1 hypothetical protein AA103196_2371 [Ameyamaea chiangmaiensis NBRC 103196]
MPAFIVFCREALNDPKEFDLYSSKVGATFEGHPVTPLAVYGEQEVLEGDPNDGTVILQFPTMEAARTWYNSPAYQDAVQHRFKAAKYNVVLVQGV